MSFSERIKDKIFSGKSITHQDTEALLELQPLILFEIATAIREYFRGKKVDLCSILNAKSGGCSEDCFYCAQSARYQTKVERYPLLSKETIVERAKEAQTWKARRFCIVTSGKKVNPKELEIIASAISEIRALGFLPCATLGILDRDELQVLKEAGLYRYHHNIETSRRFFPRVCTTHSFNDKIGTIRAAQEVGLSICSGGIFGVGETWRDRIDMAFTLKDIGVDSVPINFLIPIKGTPLENRPFLNPVEALKIVSLFRLVMPEKEIRICGGRGQTLKGLQSMAFFAGADGLLVGNYLTQKGSPVEDDLFTINALGLEIARN